MTDQERMEKLISAAKELGYENFLFIAESKDILCHTVQGFSLIEALGLIEMWKPKLVKIAEETK